MKLLLDSANLDDIRECVSIGIIDGVTVNQSLLAKEPKRPYLDHVSDIASILTHDMHLSIPITDLENSVEQAAQLREVCGAIRPTFKVPVSWLGLKCITQLFDADFNVNATCIYSGQQALLASQAGANYLSVFVGRINDINKDVGYATIASAKQFGTVIAGSIRDATMVALSFQRGADYVTTSKAVLTDMAHVEGSITSAAKFDKDFQEWTQQ